MPELIAVDLRCEHLFEPQGLNTRQPRLTWAVEGAGRGRAQAAYRIVAGSDPSAVQAGRGDCWDTGRVASPESLLVPYAGRRLRTDETIHWSVQIWDEAGKEHRFCSPSRFRTGLLDPTDWSAKWIARPLIPPGGRTPPQNTPYDNPYGARPADYLRRDITIARRLVRATIYATALGVYELEVNGTRVGDQVLAPGWTDYHTRVEYQSYDATGLFRPGANAIGAILGEGWYCGRVALDPKRAGSHYGSRPALMAQIHLEYDDGAVEVVGTDRDWTCGQAAIVYSDLQLGEKYDARLEALGWSEPGFTAEGWWPASEIQPLPRAPRIEAARGAPIRKMMERPAQFLRQAPSGRLIFDLGQNLAGHVRMEIEAPRNAALVLRHGEALDAEGELYTENLRWALATDTYISKGGRQVFEPRFTVHGFRYVELSAPDGLGPQDVQLTGVAVHSDMEVSGEFECGSPMVNQLVSNIMWTQRSNFISVPTDCPQRDERMGWLGDAQVFFRTASCNMDVAAFFTKFLVDIADAQAPDGSFTDVAPSLVYTRFAPNPPKGAPGWGDAGIIIPWRMYERYGDLEVLDQYYESMVRWIDLIDLSNPDRIRNNAVNSNWGDWLCLGDVTPKNVIATAYWAYITDIMTRVSARLRKRQDEARFTALRRDIGAAFQAEFVARDGRIAGDTQTAYLLALAFDLLDAADRPKAANHLLRTIAAAGGHVHTGILGIQFIGPVLSEFGATDTAYSLLLNETFPSWGFSIRNGATTIWERWDGWTPERGFQDVAMNSLNHYALGAVGEWLYARVAGIDADEAAPAYRRIRMRPLPSHALGWCRAALRTHLGTIASEWRLGDEGLNWQVTVPINCSAAAELPPQFTDIRLDGRPLAEMGTRAVPTADGGIAFEIGSGSYTFSAKER